MWRGPPTHESIALPPAEHNGGSAMLQRSYTKRATMLVIALLLDFCNEDHTLVKTHTSGGERSVGLRAVTCLMRYVR